MEDRKILYIIRRSDGAMKCYSGTYEAAAMVAEEYVKGTDLTYTIV